MKLKYQEEDLDGALTEFQLKDSNIKIDTFMQVDGLPFFLVDLFEDENIAKGKLYIFGKIFN
jgi:hypothetical protein